jgi:hypothetical protein
LKEMQQHQLDRSSFSTAASYSQYGTQTIGGWLKNAIFFIKVERSNLSKAFKISFIFTVCDN